MLNFCSGLVYNIGIAEVAELADAHDSKSCTREGVRVRFPPSAHGHKNATVNNTVAFLLPTELYNTRYQLLITNYNLPVTRPNLLAWLFWVALGLGLGLYGGWVLAPVEYTDTTADTLQQVYKDDYVLMLATAFAADGDLATAQAGLASLGLTDPAAALQATADRLEAAGYPEQDLQRLAALAAALGEAP